MYSKKKILIHKGRTGGGGHTESRTMRGRPYGSLYVSHGAGRAEVTREGPGVRCGGGRLPSTGTGSGGLTPPTPGALLEQL